MDNKLKHLEFILAVISRMANCSFLIKGWSITLVAALFAIAGKEHEPHFVYVAYFPAIMFWALDGFFLHQEKLFRSLYEKTRKLATADIDFSMNTGEFRNSVDSWIAVCFSRTLLLFHGGVIATIVMVAALMFKG